MEPWPTALCSWKRPPKTLRPPGRLRTTGGVWPTTPAPRPRASSLHCHERLCVSCPTGGDRGTRSGHQPPPHWDEAPQSSCFPCDRSQDTGHCAGKGWPLRSCLQEAPRLCPLAHLQCPTITRPLPQVRHCGNGGLCPCPLAPEASVPQEIPVRLCPRQRFYWMLSPRPPLQAPCVHAGGKPSLRHERATL